MHDFSCYYFTTIDLKDSYFGLMLSLEKFNHPFKNSIIAPFIDRPQEFWQNSATMIFPPKLSYFEKGINDSLLRLEISLNLTLKLLSARYIFSFHPEIFYLLNCIVCYLKDELESFSHHSERFQL